MHLLLIRQGYEIAHEMKSELLLINHDGSESQRLEWVMTDFSANTTSVIIIISSFQITVANK